MLRCQQDHQQHPKEESGKKEPSRWLRGKTREMRKPLQARALFAALQGDIRCLHKGGSIPSPLTNPNPFLFFGGCRRHVHHGAHTHPAHTRIMQCDVKSYGFFHCRPDLSTFFVRSKDEESDAAKDVKTRLHLNRKRPGTATRLLDTLMEASTGWGSGGRRTMGMNAGCVCTTGDCRGCAAAEADRLQAEAKALTKEKEASVQWRDYGVPEPPKLKKDEHAKQEAAVNMLIQSGLLSTMATRGDHSGHAGCHVCNRHGHSSGGRGHHHHSAPHRGEYDSDFNTLAIGDSTAQFSRKFTTRWRLESDDDSSSVGGSTRASEWEWLDEPYGTRGGKQGGHGDRHHSPKRGHHGHHGNGHHGHHRSNSYSDDENGDYRDHRSTRRNGQACDNPHCLTHTRDYKENYRGHHGRDEEIGYGSFDEHGDEDRRHRHRDKRSGSRQTHHTTHRASPHKSSSSPSRSRRHVRSEQQPCKYPADSRDGGKPVWCPPGTKTHISPVRTIKRRPQSASY